MKINNTFQIILKNKSKYINYILIGLILIYIIYIIYNTFPRISYSNKDIVEHLISDESRKVDILSKNSLSWLKNKVKQLNIDKRDISVNLPIKEAYSKAILTFLPIEHLEYMLKLSTYSIDRLKEEASKLEIPVAIYGDNREKILTAIDTQTNPQHLLDNMDKSMINVEEEEEERIKHKTTKHILRNCPRITNKCLEDKIENDYKYSQCLSEDGYEKCMTCFNNKIRESEYIGKGTKFSSDTNDQGCNYKDMELLCMRANPLTCNDGKYLSCPCKLSDNEDNYDIETKREHDKYYDKLNEKHKYILPTL